ncbi:MAG: PQQ-dependent sugar dehydrogenase [Acidobacteriota bacterium]
MVFRPAFVLLSLMTLAAQVGQLPLVPIILGGNERLAWDQAGNDDTGIGTLRYIVYVDGKAVDLTGESCSRSSSSAGFSCSAPLPPLTIGLHSLDIAAASRGSSLQTSRSNRLLVLAVRSTQVRSQPSPTAGVAATTILTSDRVRLTVTPIVTGLADAVDLAFLPDGRMVVAERDGLLRIVRNGRLVATPPSPTVDGGVERDRLLAVTVDANFDRSHFVYAIYTTTSAEGDPAFSLVRFRETGDTFADRLIIADDVPASPDGAAAALRFGPDGKLFAAFDNGGRPQLAADLSSYNGKVLRLNPDGTTPADQRGYLPLYSSAYRSPRGLAWHLPSRILWIISQETDGARLSAIASEGVPLRGIVRTALTLPAGMVPSGVAVYPSTGMAELFRGNILITSDQGRSLLRLQTDPLVPTRILATEQLLQDQIGGIRAPAVGPDGAIYLATESTIWRLSPAANDGPASIESPRRR